MKKMIGTIVATVMILSTLWLNHRVGEQRAALATLADHYQAACDSLAVAELAQEIYLHFALTDSLPASIERTAVPSYGAEDPYPFAGFAQRWPHIQLVTVPSPSQALSGSASYIGIGFILVSGTEESGYFASYHDGKLVPSNQAPGKVKTIYYLHDPFARPENLSQQVSSGKYLRMLSNKATTK